MRLIKARVKGYRSIIDTGCFDIEEFKTILVGPNEAGKTAILQALQKLNPPKGTALFNPLRDYPRSKYDEDISNHGINQDDFTVVEGHFSLNDEEKEDLPEGYGDIIFVAGRYLNNKSWYRLENAPQQLTYADIEKDIKRLAAHIDKNYRVEDSLTQEQASPVLTDLNSHVKEYTTKIYISTEDADSIIKWMDKYFSYVTEGSEEESRFDELKAKFNLIINRAKAMERCKAFLPTFVLFSNYFRVKPSIHLEHLTQRVSSGVLDDDQYDYGNLCLLKLLKFSAADLSKAGKAVPANSTPAEVQKYKDVLDDRNYRLNAASIRLTKEITRVWNPNPNKPEANKLRVDADGQYLKVVVEDSLGVEVELDQRSEGFQWLVSFFVVFFAEASDKHKNTILLLDEPGLSLHGLKQAEFRETLSRLSESNQTIYTTHSPFLVGPNELDLVRVVEMETREAGTIVHTSVTASDSAALLPLQEALGYDLAQTLFFHKKNLVLEGLTDYWYVEAVSELCTEVGLPQIDEKISLNPANSAGKVVYYATILHAQSLKVAALLDSDTEGDNAATQETLVNALGNKRILRTKDIYSGSVSKPEIEDLFRETLIAIANDELKWNVKAVADKQKSRPIVDIFTTEIKGFSKYQLAKAFLRWTRGNNFSDLTDEEQEHCKKLVDMINKALK
ncbi:MAG: AAA family ATPase [Methanomicrobiales archaeon]|nr:AAA family ATPase [Methanomicrobiales archaeon]